MDLTNHLIIAMPGLTDPIFKKSVSFICQHTAQGAMGLTINRPTDINFSELLTQLKIPLDDSPLATSFSSIPVYLGGPLEREHGFILHSNDTQANAWEQTIKINEQLSLSSSKDILTAIACGQGTSHYLIALGYAAWTKGQLEQEMQENSWLNTPADNEILFHTPFKQRWESAALNMGIDIHLISGDIGHA